MNGWNHGTPQRECESGVPERAWIPMADSQTDVLHCGWRLDQQWDQQFKMKTIFV